MRQVTEADFRKPGFENAKTEDYEIRKDGAVVRKDRWETGFKVVVGLVGLGRAEFEIDQVLTKVAASTITRSSTRQYQMSRKC